MNDELTILRKLGKSSQFNQGKLSNKLGMYLIFNGVANEIPPSYNDV
jgi:hypothetical protein